MSQAGTAVPATTLIRRAGLPVDPGRLAIERSPLPTSAGSDPRSNVVAILAVCAGIAAALAPPAPTGRAAVDAVIVALAASAVTIAAARARSWTVILPAGAAVGIGINPAVIVAGAAAVVLAGLAVGSRSYRPVIQVAAAGLAVNALARAELDRFFGLTSIVSIAVCTLIFVAGVSRSSRRVRRAVVVAVGALIVVAAGSTVAFGYAAFKARHLLADGLYLSELAIASLEGGDYEASAELFDQSSRALDAAHEQLTVPWAFGAGFVPVVAQHRNAAVDMSAAGSAGAAVVADALDDIDMDALRLRAGRIDLDAVDELSEPLGRVHDALVDLQTTVDRSRSPWLVGRADYELADFDLSIAEHLPQLEKAIEAVGLAPQLLGADGQRVYLVLFTTPSEARGLGGFIGNFAELWVDDGRLELRTFGRASELDYDALEAGARVSGPDEFVRRYGGFGYDHDGNGQVGDAAFRNLTMTPNFPWVGEIARDVYAQTTGRTVDGVIAMDPYVVTALLNYTGPIQLSSFDQQLDAGNAAWFLLRDQYVLGADDNEQRTEAIAEAAELTIDALLSGTMPDPTTFARDLGPLVADRRLLAWSPDPSEQALFERVHLDGAIPQLDGRDGWSIAVSNASGNKIDSFLERRMSYQSATNPATGLTTARLRVELTNTAPATGLPRYVIGNRVGLPEGTSRLYVSAYSPLSLVNATLDGRPEGVAIGVEAGWNVYARFVEIPPGATVVLEYQFVGTLQRPHELVTWEQPMATDVTFIVD